MQASISSNLLEFKLEGTKKEEDSKLRSERNRGKKRKMNGLSSKSKYNLAKELSKVSWPHPPAHLTLTYWKEYPTLEDPKRDLNKLTKWLREHGFTGVWRLEFQGREKDDSGKPALYVPHYHILLSGEFSPEMEKRIRIYWAKLSGNDSSRAVVITYREEAKAAWYLAMHTQKTDQTPDIECGRWWGIINPKQFKEWQVETVAGTLNHFQKVKLFRIVRSFLNSQKRVKIRSIEHGIEIGNVEPEKGKAKIKILKSRVGYCPNGRQSFSLFLPEHMSKKLLLWIAEEFPELNQDLSLKDEYLSRMCQNGQLERAFQ